MKAFAQRALRGAPHLLGVLYGVFLYVVHEEISSALSIWIGGPVMLAFLAFGLLMMGRRVVCTRPQVGLAMMEPWMVVAIILTAACTWGVLWLTSALTSDLPLESEQSGAALAVGGAVSAYLSLLLLEDVAEGKGMFHPGGQFKAALGACHEKGRLEVKGGTKEWDAIYEPRVQAGGPEGWGFRARWERARIVSSHLKFRAGTSEDRTPTTPTRES